MTWPEASYLAWVRVEGLGDDPAEVIREQGKVALTSGSAFGSPGVGHVRINFATSEAIVAEVVSRLGSVVAAHASSRYAACSVCGNHRHSVGGESAGGGGRAGGPRR